MRDIIAMGDDRVVRQGPPADLVTSPVPRDVYDLDVEVQAINGHRIGVFST